MTACPFPRLLCFVKLGTLQLFYMQNMDQAANAKELSSAAHLVKSARDAATKAAKLAVVEEQQKRKEEAAAQRKEAARKARENKATSKK